MKLRNWKNVLKNLNPKGDLMEEKKRKSPGLMTEITQCYIGDDLERAKDVYERAKKIVLNFEKVAFIFLIGSLIALTIFSILDEYVLFFDEFTEYRTVDVFFLGIYIGILIFFMSIIYSVISDAAKDRIKQIEYHQEMMEKERE